MKVATRIVALSVHLQGRGQGVALPYFTGSSVRRKNRWNRELGNCHVSQTGRLNRPVAEGVAGLGGGEGGCIRDKIMT